MSQETTFDYNKEVVDLLLKNVIGTQYTSSELTPGQENLSLTTIQHEQIYSQPIPTSSKSNMIWSTPEPLVGGGTISYLKNVIGEGNNFTYIKKYENIMMEPAIIQNNENRAWIPINTLIRENIRNMIKGRIAFNFILETDIVGANIINSDNGQFNPIVNNGILLFLGETYPEQNKLILFKELYIYEGKFGLEDITFPKSTGELSIEENVGKIYFNTDENKFLECVEDEEGNIEWQPLGSSFYTSPQFVGQPPAVELINTEVTATYIEITIKYPIQQITTLITQGLVSDSNSNAIYTDGNSNFIGFPVINKLKLKTYFLVMNKQKQYLKKEIK